MAQNQHSDVPRQLRELTERNVEQARSACSQFIDTMAQATSMWLSAMPSNETTSGLKAIHEQAACFAKQSAEACFAFASELANARDMQDVLGMQGRYAQKQMQAYGLQVQELGRLMAEASRNIQPRS
jgi:hypothetical protein